MADLIQTERLTMQEFYQMFEESMDRIELINGEVVKQPNSTTHTHQYVVGQVALILSIYEKGKKLGSVEISPNDVHLDNFNVLQPDVFFVAKDNDRCKLGEDDYWHGAPDLCVEVISEGTEKRDRIDKFAIYAQHGVREYWIIDPGEHTVEVYILEKDIFKKRGSYTENETFSSIVLPGLQVSVNKIFPSKTED